MQPDDVHQPQPTGDDTENRHSGQTKQQRQPQTPPVRRPSTRVHRKEDKILLKSPLFYLTADQTEARQKSQ